MDNYQTDAMPGKVLRGMLIALVVGVAGLMLVLSQTVLGGVWGRLFDSLLGVSSGHVS